MNDFQLGKHEEAIQSIKSDMTAMQSDVREIRDILAEQRGERRVKVMAFGALGGSGGALIIKLFMAKLGMHG